MQPTAAVMHNNVAKEKDWNSNLRQSHQGREKEDKFLVVRVSHCVPAYQSRAVRITERSFVQNSRLTKDLPARECTINDEAKSRSVLCWPDQFSEPRSICRSLGHQHQRIRHSVKCDNYKKHSLFKFLFIFLCLFIMWTWWWCCVVMSVSADPGGECSSWLCEHPQPPQPGCSKSSHSH